MPGEEDIKFVKAGSNLNLTCYISQMSNERKLLQWTRDGQVRRLDLELILIGFSFLALLSIEPSRAREPNSFLLINT